MNSIKLNNPNELITLQKKLLDQKKDGKVTITICAGTGCLACGCKPVTDAFKEALIKNKLENNVEIKTTGCHGFCERGPLVVIQPEGLFYQRVKPKDANTIVEKTILQKKES